MKYVFLLSCVVFNAGLCHAQVYRCLPNEVKESTPVRFETVSLKSGQEKVEKITVKKTLSALKARCSRGKLIDGNGKQIRFFFLQTCWGNPPEDYREIIEKQRKEILALRRRFNVIEITCQTGEQLV